MISVSCLCLYDDGIGDDGDGGDVVLEQVSPKCSHSDSPPEGAVVQKWTRSVSWGNREWSGEENKVVVT